MPYNHSLNASITFKAGITEAAALKAIQPLAVEHGWSQEEMLSNTLPEHSTIEITVVDGFAVSIKLFTCGEVPYNYAEVVHELADGLAELAEADFIELRDHSTHDLSSAILELWYGAPDEIEPARQKHAWRKAVSLLHAAGVPEESLRPVREAMTASNQPAVAVVEGNS